MPERECSPESRASLVLGLGNPGHRYASTRHNLGFRVVELLARRWEVSLSCLECNALLAERGNHVLAAPQTYMNRSGYAARCLKERRSLDPKDFLVVFDDLNLPLGRMRFRSSGGPGGHRGMESVIRNLETEKVARLRLGIASERLPERGDEQVDFVLSPFRPDERKQVEEVVERAADACECWLTEDPETTMNRFNG